MAISAREIWVDVILDIALEREPFVETATRLIDLALRQEKQLFVSATSITDLFYIIRKSEGRSVAYEFLADLIAFVDIAGVDRRVIIEAIQTKARDFEDAVQMIAAFYNDADVIITRNPADFVSSSVSVMTTTDALRWLASGK